MRGLRRGSILLRLLELVRDTAHKDVELVIVVRGGTVHYNINKVKRTREGLTEYIHPRGATQMISGRVTGKHGGSGNDVDVTCGEMIADLAEAAVKAGLPLKHD